MTPNFILVQTHHHFHLRLLPLNLAPWEFMTGSWTMIFTSIHLSLRPSHSSTQGLSPFKPLLNQLSPSMSRVHLSNFRHQSRIWVSILTPDYLSINRFQKTCKASYFHIRALRHIRSSLTAEAAKTVATAIVGSRLDYCNSLLAGTSVSNLSRLQLVQNTLARVVAQKSRFDHITPVLSELHWLPVRHRINFQDSCHHSHGPAVSAALLPRCTHSTLCACAITPLLIILVNMCFLCAKPPWQPLDRFRRSHQKIWNALPGHLSSIPTLPAFRRALKHHFFLVCLSWQ